MIDDQFVPNKQYLLREELESIKNAKPGPASGTHFSRTFAGATYLFDAIGEHHRITNDLQICFPESSGDHSGSGDEFHPGCFDFLGNFPFCGQTDNS